MFFLLSQTQHRFICLFCRHSDSAVTLTMRYAVSSFKIVAVEKTVDLLQLLVEASAVSSESIAGTLSIVVFLICVH